MLLSLGREMDVLYAEIAGAVVDVVINLLLIPKYGAAGAAAGTLVAEIVVWIVMLIEVSRLKDDVYRHIYKNVHAGKIFIALAAASAAAVGFKFADLNAALILCISAVIFFGIYGMLLMIVKEPGVTELISIVSARFGRKD